MKCIYVIIFTILLNYTSTFGQTGSDCACLVNLEKIVVDIESNYPGYKVKTQDGKKQEYIVNKRQSLSLASKTFDREECFYVIERYLGFFKDNHIIFTDTKTKPSKIKAIGKIEKLIGQDKDSLIGKWSRPDGSLSIKIKKINSNLYQGIINSKNGKLSPNATYFELIGNHKRFKVRKHGSWLTTDLLRGRVVNNRLVEPDGVWIRGDAKVKIQEEKRTVTHWNNRFRYEKLDGKVYYLGIPEFNTEENKFDSIIKNHVISDINTNKIEHLIIDLRNNFGGNSSFLSLLRLTYEEPFSVPGDFVYASPSMIEKYTEHAIQGSKRHSEMLPKLIANKGGFVQRDSLSIRLKEKVDYPKEISIIVNDNCASSTEYFLMLARKSSKVKIYGRNTAGTLDYSELLHPENLPCKDYRYLRPTSKSFFADTTPIDNIGIRPDIDLSHYSDDEWVNIIRSSIQKRVITPTKG